MNSIKSFQGRKVKYYLEKVLKCTTRETKKGTLTLIGFVIATKSEGAPNPIPICRQLKEKWSILSDLKITSSVK